MHTVDGIDAAMGQLLDAILRDDEAPEEVRTLAPVVLGLVGTFLKCQIRQMEALEQAAFYAAETHLRESAR